MLGYSKGAVDIQQFLNDFPELSRGVVAMVSVGGPLWGTPLANRGDWLNRHLFAHLYTDRCPPGDSGLIHSLQPEVRKQWLSTHPLPSSVHVYSLAAFTTSPHLARGLRPTWSRLAEYDTRNDGQVLIGDTVLAGSDLLGYVNSDHWGAAITIENELPYFAGRESPRPIPQAQLLLAIWLYVGSRSRGPRGPRGVVWRDCARGSACSFAIARVTTMRFSKEHDRGPTAASSNRSPSPHAATSVLFFAAILAWSPSGFASDAVSPPLRTDQFRAVYEPPKNAAHQALYEQLKAARTLERFRVLLSYIRLPRTLTLKLAGCDGDEDAWYDPEALTVTVCYEYLEAVHKIAPASATPEGVTPENAVLGPLLEVFLHEVTACICSISCASRSSGAKRMPPIQFAAFTLVHLSEHGARYRGWRRVAVRPKAKEPTLNHADLADVHGLAGQRFYNLRVSPTARAAACLRIWSRSSIYRSRAKSARTNTDRSRMP
jgi:hypothetical protein